MRPPLPSWNFREVPPLENRRPRIEGSFGWDDGVKLVQVMDRVTLSPTEVAARSRLALTFWPSALAASNNTKLNARILLISPILGYPTVARLVFLGGAINTLLLLEGVEQLANLLRGHLAVRLCLAGVGLLLAGLGL